LLENVANFVHRFRNWATQSANGTDRRGRASDLLQKGII
jgi:flagellin-like hook-associated protein FlgL